MQYFGNLVVVGGLVLQLYAGWRMKPRLQYTSLTATWWIWLFAWACWACTWGVTGFIPNLSPGIADQLWYATTVLTVAVPIAVLGARRPGHIVWLLFVLLPLILVLCWPAWLEIPRTWQGTRLSLEEPTVLGVGLVAVMGFGNYFGTRWTLATLLVMTAITAVIWPISIWGNTLQIYSPMFRTGAILANSLAALVIVMRISSESTSRSHVTANGPVVTDLQNHLAINRQDAYNPPEISRRVDGFNQLWFAFRDVYGLVWARRFQERINQIADREKWPMRLEWFGWVEHGDNPSATPKRDAETQPSTSSAVVSPNLFEQMEQQQRWLLTRFVQPAWINRHLA